MSRGSNRCLVTTDTVASVPSSSAMLMMPRSGWRCATVTPAGQIYRLGSRLCLRPLHEGFLIVLDEGIGMWRQPEKRPSDEADSDIPFGGSH